MVNFDVASNVDILSLLVNFFQVDEKETPITPLAREKASAYAVAKAAKHLSSYSVFSFANQWHGGAPDKSRFGERRAAAVVAEAKQLATRLDRFQCVAAGGGCSRRNQLRKSI
ncbi:hypothetical protein [Mesorhizobium sp. M0243]|uniref:hypothetical protein n=1 Tax=Mesorhizobium sp. M0243 TaxID=2956925 RepID=UPI0033384C85